MGVITISQAMEMATVEILDILVIFTHFHDKVLESLSRFVTGEQLHPPDLEYENLYKVKIIKCPSMYIAIYLSTYLYVH